jgi:uncharacterized repeat protein (TIGR03803 family)
MQSLQGVSAAARARAFAFAPAIVIWAALVVTPLSRAQTFTVLYAFGPAPDAAFPTAVLVRDPAGNLYGTTIFGGAFFNGAVFRVDASGNETVLYSFTGGTDGGLPFAGLIRDTQGNLYGTTTQGGDLRCAFPIGCGTVFKVDSAGNETVLHRFTVGLDGEFPYGGLFRDSAGNLYGTTLNGGSSANYGTVYKVASSGRETVLYRFTGKADGAFPFGGLIADATGRLYGTTSQFGTSGGGTVFRRSSAGQLITLDNLQATSGESPIAGVIRDGAGNLYGTASFGGAYGAGAVFKINPSGIETILYSFTNGSDGGTPYAGVIRDVAGNLYGTTFYGGSAAGTNGFGTVFKVDAASNFTVLYTFTGGTDGGSPWGGLTIDAAGHLYGTNAVGGANGNGVVFKLTP